jgi:hypothetical protein
MGKLIRLFVLILLFPMIFSFAHEAYLFVRSNITFQEIAWLLGGFLLYILIDILSPKDTIRFWAILEHELGHAIAHLAFFEKPKKLEVDVEKGQGKVESQGKGCFLTTLAPYYLPVFTLPLLPIALIAPPLFDKGVAFLIGVTLGFHYAGIFRDFHRKQTDLKTTGFIFAFVVMLILNVVFLIVILGFVIKDLGSVWDYFKNSFVRTFESYKAIIQAIKSIDFPSLDELWKRLPGRT